MNHAVIIAKRLIRLYNHNVSWWLQALVCYLLLVIINHLCLGPTIPSRYVSHGILIASAVIASSISPFQELHHDYKNGQLQQFMMLGIWNIIPGSVYLGIRLIVVNTSFALILPLSLLLLSIPYTDYMAMLRATVIVISYNLIITFLVCCLSISKPNNLLLAALSIPLTVPGIVLAVLGIEQPYYHALALAFIMALLPLTSWMGEKILLATLIDA